jgi:hypothetical protein
MTRLHKEFPMRTLGEDFCLKCENCGNDSWILEQLNCKDQEFRLICEECVSYGQVKFVYYRGLQD